MTLAVVNPGVCGMDTTISVTKLSKQQFSVEVTTACEMITKLGELLSEIDLADILKPQIHSTVYQYASECQVHISCPVPMAILKVIEVEAALALPRTVTVHFQSS